jgi:hypothetical protein
MTSSALTMIVGVTVKFEAWAVRRQARQELRPGFRGAIDKMQVMAHRWEYDRWR